MSITIRVTEQETELIKRMAEFYGKTVSEYIRTTLLEKIEDEFDIKVGEEALKEYKENPVSYSFEEVNKMLGIDNEV